MNTKRLFINLAIALAIDIAYPWVLPLVPGWGVAILIGVAAYAVGYWITGMAGMK